MVSARIEEDLLGQREVPAGAYYGVHTLRAVENFPISDRTVADVPDFVRGMVMVKKATAQANRELGALPDDIADAIEQACDQVLEQGRCLSEFPVDLFQGGAGTSLNMNTNEVIANLALEQLGHPRGSYEVINPNDHVNRSQSTNDAYPCGLKVGLLLSLQTFRTAVDELQNALCAKGEEFKDVLKMGRTQLQDAVPMTLGDEFRAWGLTLGEELARLEHAAAELREMNLGATAIGTSVNTPAGYPELAVAKLSGVTGWELQLAPNLIKATSDCGPYVTVHAALKRFSTKLSKVCNDLRLLSSGPRTGLNEINLPEMQAGSSIMPAKVNPVIPEVVNQVCFKVIGNDVTVSMAAEAGQLQLNVMEPVIAQCMFESISLLTQACKTLTTRCVDGVTANEEVCRDYVLGSIGIVTYLNDLIGHHNGDLVGKECARSGRNVREVVLEMGLLDAQTLDQILSVENLSHPRDITTLTAQREPKAAR
ncbi:aspartate ammonia-lyase [Gephyromycinifex aptenodytis]|nr:aspartate ammonia-lyase [Gephyromycinifex aptenodytis]